MKLLYIDPVMGLSGDMLLSAFIDAGYPQKEIEKTLRKVPIDCPKIFPEKIEFGEFSGFRLQIEEKKIELSPNEMLSIAEEIDVEEKVRKDLKGMLNILFEAESKIHGVEKEKLHIHELSNIDTFLDFLLVASAMSYFEIQRVFVGAIPHGTGFIETSHGILPNPPPVTLEMLKDFISIFTYEHFELTTPTGAAIVKYYVNPQEKFTGMRVLSTGCGVGNYRMKKPDILRVFIGEGEAQYLHDEIKVVEFDVDDMEMEYTGLLADKLRSSGAIEVLYFPVFMKKGRIGVRFSVLTYNENLEGVIDAVFNNSTTFGLRIRGESRRLLKRDEKIVKTKYGDVRIKVGYGKNNEVLRKHVEFDDIKRICEKTGTSYLTVLNEIKSEI